MAVERRIVSDPLDVHARLQLLGLKAGELRNSLIAGASALALYSHSNYPPIYGGLSFWAEAVKALRDRKMEDGWSRSDARNYSTVVSPDRAIQVAIARGDEWTGQIEDVPDGRPSTLHKKGSATQLAVEQNQLSLFDALPDNDMAGAPIVTWVLLHYLLKHRIRCELSQPSAISKAGYVEAWKERIILGEIDLEPERITLPDEPPVAPDVLVRRRGENRCV